MSAKDAIKRELPTNRSNWTPENMIPYVVTVVIIVILVVGAILALT